MLLDLPWIVQQAACQQEHLAGRHGKSISMYRTVMSGLSGASTTWEQQRKYAMSQAMNSMLTRKNNGAQDDIVNLMGAKKEELDAVCKHVIDLSQGKAHAQCSTAHSSKAARLLHVNKHKRCW